MVRTTSATSGPSGSALTAALRLAVRVGDLRQGVLQRRRERAGQRLEQLGEPDAGRRADRDHRVERAAGDGRLQVVDQRVGLDGPRRSR